MKKTKKQMSKKNNGITLIALVITIIVLLILAGVSISMLTGQNGILNRAQEAKEKTESANDMEKIELAVQSALLNNKGTIDLTKSDEDEEKVGLEKELEEVLGTKKYIYEGNGIVKYNNIVCVVSKEGIISWKSQMTPVNYGEECNYMDLDGNENTADWQIFYDDGLNVYLIAKDYVQLSDATKNSTGMTTNGYFAWWDVAPEKYTLEIFDNGKCVAALLDSDNWKEFLDDSKAEYAIGGPTIELFAKSYNEKYPNEINGIIEYQLVTTEINKGYQVRWLKNNDGLWDTNISGLKTTDNMYVKTSRPIKDENGKCNAYWIASPCVIADSSMMLLYYGGVISSHNYYYSNYFGVRPVVCLKSNIKLTKDNDIWNIN